MKTTYNSNGYGGVAYYTSEKCGFLNGIWISTQCINDYEQSEVKYVVDAWSAVKVPAAIEARLIQYNEFKNLGYVDGNVTPSDIGLIKSE